MRVVEFAPGYKVSDSGKVWGPRGCELKPVLSNGKYLAFTCYHPKKKQLSVHNLVAKAFVSNPRPDIFDEVDHIDRDKKNNHASNLRWLNRSLNLLNNDAKGTWKQGNRFKARVMVNYKRFNLGSYATEQAASEVARKFRKKTFAEIYRRLVSERAPRERPPRTAAEIQFRFVSAFAKAAAEWRRLAAFAS